MAWYNFWKKTPQVSPDTEVLKSQWRNNMWVVTPYGVGILFEIGPMNTVHLVNETTGETTQAISVTMNNMRQAKFVEIPEIRRVGLSKEKAEYLGYF